MKNVGQKYFGQGSRKAEYTTKIITARVENSIASGGDYFLNAVAPDPIDPQAKS